MTTNPELGTPRPALRMGSKVPLFYLPSTSGGQSGPASTRSKYNLVLAFLESGPPAESYLCDLARLYPSILTNDARVLPILQATLNEATRIAADLNLPFPLLSEADGTTTRRILGEPNHAGLYVADRYGVLYLAEAVPTTADLPPAQTALDWLDFIEIQCPE